MHCCQLSGCSVVCAGRRSQTLPSCSDTNTFRFGRYQDRDRATTACVSELRGGVARLVAPVTKPGTKEEIKIEKSDILFYRESHESCFPVSFSYSDSSSGTRGSAEADVSDVVS